MFQQQQSARPRTARQTLTGPFRTIGGYGWSKRIPNSGGDDDHNLFGSSFCLYENDTRLLAAHTPGIAITSVGQGRYLHWENEIYFSTTDNSDPNTNGRAYSFDYSLNPEEAKRDRIARSATRWLWHPRGAEILARGGDLVPPPVTANLGLTNKCNLRCEICGSQKHLDKTGVRRRHMEFTTFEAVAETLFPLLSVVELNSQGDPLLYPRIKDVLKIIQKHRCEVKIQHNGTLLTNSTIDLILQQYGSIMLSLDAVGDKFDEVRRGGVWAKAHAGLERLLKERDPTKLSVGVYPTLTKRTIGEALNVARWCKEHGIEVIGFHRYVPIQDSFEEPPTEDEYNAMRQALRQWCNDNGDAVSVMFEDEVINSTAQAERRTQFPDPLKKAALVEAGKFMFPVEASNRGADQFTSCSAPHDYVEIGLEAQIGACCRAQDIALGHATSIESFASAWLGANYDRIRRSLRRGAGGAYPLPNCAGCVKFFAPKEAEGREAVNYATPPRAGEERLDFTSESEIELEVIQKETGHCHIVAFPIGLGHTNFELWENDKLLGPGDSLHETIRREGKGAYHLGPTAIYFSTSDGTDARRNGRSYVLRPIETA